MSGELRGHEAWWRWRERKLSVGQRAGPEAEAMSLRVVVRERRDPESTQDHHCPCANDEHSHSFPNISKSQTQAVCTQQTQSALSYLASTDPGNPRCRSLFNPRFPQKSHILRRIPRQLSSHRPRFSARSQESSPMPSPQWWARNAISPRAPQQLIFSPRRGFRPPLE
jgi:hypothetical protein